MDLASYTVSRVDVAQVYDLGSPGAVAQALLWLRGVDAGRYHPEVLYGSVYWGRTSGYRGGVAYAKGPHIARLHRRGEIAPLSDGDLSLARRLLRLELRCKRKFHHELRSRGVSVWDVREDEWVSHHQKYFVPIIGTRKEIGSDCQLLTALQEDGHSPRMVRSVFATYSLIQSLGYAAARERSGRATFFRHVGYLRAVGLNLGDLSGAHVLSFRPIVLRVAEPVSSWEELRAAA